MLRFLCALLVLFLFSLFSASAAVREKTLGMGLTFGDMTGISLKTWRGEETAIDAGFSWSKNELKFSVSFLNHFFDIIDAEKKNVPVYYGLGSRVKVRADNSDENTLGLRIPAGISYIFTGNPIDTFFEIVPVLSLVPETSMDLTANMGLRYYF